MKWFSLITSIGKTNTQRNILWLIIIVLCAGLSACDYFGKGPQKPKSEAGLNPPQEFQAQVKGANVTLTWRQMPNLEYNLYIASEPGVTPLTVDRLKSGAVHKGVNSPFVLQGLQEGTTYYCILTAADNSGESDPSIEISATPVSLVPATPTVNIEPPKNFQAKAGDGQITLTWDPVTNALQYNLYMATEYGINPKLYGQLHNGMAYLNVTSPFTIYGLKNHEVHYFVITAVDENGEGPISAEIFATPSPPTPPPTPRNFTARAGNQQITLYWDAHPEIERYNIYAATEPGVTAEAYSRLPGSLTIRNVKSPYIFRGLNNNVTYYFVMTGETDAGGESQPTQEITATPRFPQLPAPSNVQALPSDRKITLRWQESKGAERYNVYMAQQPGLSPKSIRNFTSGVVFENATSPFEIDDLKNGTTYYLVVTAANNLTESKPGQEIAATPKKPYIPPPPRSQGSIRNYVTLDNNGRPFEDQAKPYSLQPWYCVQSKKTGLVWEVKTTDKGLRDTKHTYSWYNPDNAANGGVVGVKNGGNCTGSECDIYAFAQAVNSSKLCGFNDWRLPTRKELLTLVDTSAAYPRPTIDIDAFPNTANTYHWTSTVYEFDPKMAWFVYFGSGYDYYEYKSFASHVRLVRGPIKQAAQAEK
jgi:fibronectin type 3 domain-containing protein